MSQMKVQNWSPSLAFERKTEEHPTGIATCSSKPMRLGRCIGAVSPHEAEQVP